MGEWLLQYCEIHSWLALGYGLDGVVIGGLPAAGRPEELLRIKPLMHCALHLLQDDQLVGELMLMMELMAISELPCLHQSFKITCKLAFFEVLGVRFICL